MNYVADWYVRSWYIREDSDTVGSYTFDKYWKHIFVSEAVSTIDLADMWSRFVDWYIKEENTKIKPAMKYSGFDVIPTWFTGATFFMYNWWKCVYNPNATAITWVLYSEDYATWYWDYSWNPIYPITVSAVVNTVTVWSWLSTEENQQLMWLQNTDLTITDWKIDAVKVDTEQIITDISNIDFSWWWLTPKQEQTLTDAEVWARKAGSIRIN